MWMCIGPILHSKLKTPSFLYQNVVQFLPPAIQRTMLEYVLPAAEQIIGCQPLFIKKLQDTIAGKKTGKIASDLAQPGSHLFEKHSSGRQYCSINTMITHHINSFQPP